MLVPSSDVRRTSTPGVARLARALAVELAFALTLALLLGLAVAIASLAGCDGALPSGAERTSPSAGAGGALPPGTVSRIVVRRTRGDDAAGAVTSRFEARVEGDLRGGAVTLPDQSLLPLAASPGATPALAASFDGTEDEVRRRFPPGLYVFEVTLPDGSHRSFATFVFDDFPAFPVVVEPADGATGVPASSSATFRFTGDADRFDLLVRPAAAPEAAAIEVAIDSTAREASVEPGVLAPGTAYRLELRAKRGPASGASSVESAVVTRFTTGQ